MKEFETLAGLRSSEMISLEDMTEITSFLTLRTFSSYLAECFQHSLEVHIFYLFLGPYIFGQWMA